MSNDHATGTCRTCRKCGARVLPDAPLGVCPACLLETGLKLLSGEDDPPGRPSTPLLSDFGDYELLAEIGRGGQGVVYRARQKSLNRMVALKVIGLGHWATATHLKRFRREAEAAASLEHPRITPIYEIGELEGACYFSMKLEEGGQLDQLASREVIPLRRAAEIIASLAQTVQYAHEHGILHRDIKPGNVLLDAEGEPHLADFGLARLVETESTVTRTLEVLGTPSYIAPEQARGESAQLTSATDVYGLGAVFYQLLTGHPPFAGGTTYETIRLLLETEPRNPRLWNPKIDRDQTTICLKCLEKDPLRRYPSALALAEDLERWLRHEPIQARRTGILTRGRKWIRRNPTMAALLPLSAALFAAIGLLFWDRGPEHPPAAIAVLPFENLDGEKADAAFADGVQNEILTSLARIAGVKVISRTSVMHYRGKPDTRKIGQALNVSYVLEGSVSRAGGQIRLNTELIDTRTDTNVWAGRYERDLSDTFIVQSEIAEAIAEQLHARLSPNEKAAIEKPATQSLVAYDLYVRAVALIDPAMESDGTSEGVYRGIELLNGAIERDPNFMLAFCKLAQAHDFLYFNGERTPEQLARADSAVKSALRLAPDSGEAHFSQALNLYWGYKDYDRARSELAIASRNLPNNARIAKMAGLIDRRQGRWSEAVRELERAADLDPRNSTALDNLKTTYCMMRFYAQARHVSDRALALDPKSIGFQLGRVSIDIASRADTRPLRALVQKTLADDSSLAGAMSASSVLLALFERDLDAADRALALASREDEIAISSGAVGLSPLFWTGLVARMKGDAPTARSAFIAARAGQQKVIQAQSGYGLQVSKLGIIDACLGQRQEALAEGRQAVELLPLARDSLDGGDALYCLAVIYALTGERDLAFKQLEVLTRIPNGVTYGDLRLHPFWDPLRGDPRFEKIVASLSPKEVTFK